MATLASRSEPETAPSTITKLFVDDVAALPLAAESEAALRQFSQERLMSYGVDYADAKELRARVQAGHAWAVAAQDLAETCLAPPEMAVAPESQYSRAARLFRASALYRISQMMFLVDNAERREILDQSVRLYGEASAISEDRRPVAIEADEGQLAGWLHPASISAVGAAIVIGGVEGWAMDFGALGAALAHRGIHALLLDGPGQGQSRLANGYYLTPGFAQAYRHTVDYLEREFSGLPIGFVGNSMGGSVATVFTAMEGRIRACVNNGGPMYGTQAVNNPSFFKKMITHCGDVTEQQAVEIWSHLEPLSSPHVVTCPYLVVHGGKDPLVSDAEAAAVFERATNSDKAMVTWSDGIHCVYNHEDDKQNLIADWLAARLRPN